jgi:Fic family protein
MKELLKDYEDSNKKDQLIYLWNSLKDTVYDWSNSPYPVSHGQPHIKKVISNINQLLRIIVKDKISEYNEQITNGIFCLIASALVHDIGMCYAAQKTDKGIDYHRKRHSNIDVIKDLLSYHCRKIESWDNYEAIVKLAWAHASCDKYSSIEKIELIDNSPLIGKFSFLPAFTRLLRFADFIDIGKHRLIKLPDMDVIAQDQIIHVLKHNNFYVILDEEKRQVLVQCNEQSDLNITYEFEKFWNDAIFHFAQIQVYLKPRWEIINLSADLLKTRFYSDFIKKKNLKIPGYYYEYKGFNTFVPNPKSYKIIFSNDIVNLVSEANRELGRLFELSKELSNPYIFSLPIAYSEYEYEQDLMTMADISDVLNKDVQLFENTYDDVFSNLQALKLGLKWVKLKPIDEELINKLNQTALKRTKNEYRNVQNYIYNSIEKTIIFNPPPPTLVQKCMQEWVSYHNETNHEAIIQIAIEHWYFESIHPFIDGNGRIGRLLIDLSLVEKSLLDVPLLHFSQYLQYTKQEYYASLMSVVQEGNFDKWLKYFLNGIKEQSIIMKRKVTLLNINLQELRNKIIDLHIDITSDIINYLIENPLLSENKMRQKFNLSVSKSKNLIKILIDNGIIINIDKTLEKDIYMLSKVYTIIKT